MRPFSLKALVSLSAIVLSATVGLAYPPRPVGQSEGGVWLRIDAFLQAPLGHADVAVRDRQGNVLFSQEDATNSRGVFPALVRQLPEDFRVSVTKDFSGDADAKLRALGVVTLMADVHGYDPEFGVVYLDPATTLAAMVRDKRPGLSAEEARGVVREFLVLPDNADLGAGLAQDPTYQSPYFSEQLFDKNAGQDGGFTPFTQVLVQQMVEGHGTESFAVTTKVVPAAIAFIGTNLASGALTYLGGQGVGWILQATGLSQGGVTKEDIKKLQDGIDGLRSSVSDLQGQMQALMNQLDRGITEINLRVTVAPAMGRASLVSSVTKKLAEFADACPPLPEEGADPNEPQFSKFCEAEKADLLGQLRSNDVNHSFDFVTDHLLDSNAWPDGDGILHLYSLYLGKGRRFFRPADSQKLINMGEFWEGVQTESANLKVELLHFNGAQDDPGGVRILRGFVGNAAADPPTLGTFQQALALQQKDYAYPPVPLNTIVDTATRVMWLTNYPPAGQVRSCFGIDAGFYEYPIGRKVGNFNFRSPSLDEMRVLLASKTGDLSQWFRENTSTVAPAYPLNPEFPQIWNTDWSSCVAGLRKDLRGVLWTGTTADPTHHSTYYVFDMNNGAFKAEQPGNDQIGNNHFILQDRSLGAGENYYFSH